MGNSYGNMFGINYRDLKTSNIYIRISLQVTAASYSKSETPAVGM